MFTRKRILLKHTASGLIGTFLGWAAQKQLKTSVKMKNLVAVRVVQALARSLRLPRHVINFIPAALLAISMIPTQGAPSRQQLIDYVKTSWELTELTDDVISETLDTSYSGIPYTDYVSYFTVAPSVLNPLLSGDFKTAGKKAAGFAADHSISFLLKEAGLSGVFAPARLAAWPIEQGLNSFQNAVKEASFKNQILLYFAARSAGSSYSEIVGLGELELLPADPDILKNNRDLVMKIRYGDGQLWLAYSTSYLVGSVPGYTPSQFYDYAEQQWQSFLAATSYSAHQEMVKAAFRAAASPQNPVITQEPQDSLLPAGTSVDLKVVATGTGPLRYVWEKDGAVFSGPGFGPTFSVNTPGRYAVTVYDHNNLFTRSRTATVTVNNGEPVTITAPSANASVSGNFTVRVSATSGTKVEFYLDDVRQFTDSSTPFAWNWNTAIAANGSHALTAKAYNGATLLGTSAAVSVTVSNAAPPTCADPNEPNDSSSTATPLSFGVTANGYVCTATDVDWFKVEVATPGVLTFDLTVPTASDYDIELFGPDATYIEGSYRDSGLAENIAYDATITGTYFVRVYGYPVGNGSHNTTTSYTLVINGDTATNLLPNGGFEKPGTTLTTDFISVADNSIPGWTLTRSVNSGSSANYYAHSTASVPTSAWWIPNAYEGDFLLQLDSISGFGAAALLGNSATTSFKAEAGANYLLRFAINTEVGREDKGSISGMRVSMTGAYVMSPNLYTATNAPGVLRENAGWTVHSIGFTPSSSGTVNITFQEDGLVSGNSNVSLDGVGVFGPAAALLPPDTEYRIGLNFGANQPGGFMAPSAVAGVAEIAQANWNNLSGPNGMISSIVADASDVSEAISTTVQWTSNGTWASTGLGEENNGFAASPDRTLLTGYLDTGAATTTLVTISGIPTQVMGRYDVYIYATGGVAGRGGGYRILDGAGQVLKNYVNAQSETNPSAYTQVTVPPASGTHGIGNYIVFSGLNASTIHIEATTEGGHAFGASPRAPLNAIQLVKATSGNDPRISIVVNATGVVITYDGILESAANVSGPYELVQGAASPYRLNFRQSRQQFFRARR